MMIADCVPRPSTILNASKKNYCECILFVRVYQNTVYVLQCDVGKFPGYQ